MRPDARNNLRYLLRNLLFFVACALLVWLIYTVRHDIDQGGNDQPTRTTRTLACPPPNELIFDPTTNTAICETPVTETR